MVAAHYRGPLPPASELEKYEATLPGLADRIVTMAETQSAHRIALESQVIAASNKRSQLGLILGFVLAVLAPVIGAFLVLNGASAVGVGMMIADVGVLVGSYLYGDIMGRRERAKKAGG